MPFFFFLSRYHISIQPTSTTTAITTTTSGRLRHHHRSLRYHPYFHSIPSSPRFESGMRSLARKKGALKRFLLAMETPSPTLYRMYRVPHITNAAFPLIVPSSPFAPPSFVFLVLFLSRRFSRFFVLVPHQCLVLRLAHQTGYIGRGNPYLGSATLASVA